MNAKERIQISDLIQEVKVLKTHLSKRLVKVEGHLYDDKDTNQEGLIHEVRDIKADVASIRADLKYAKWIAGTVATAVTILVSIVAKIIGNKFF